MREKLLGQNTTRKPADQLLQKMCKADGMSAFRAWWVYNILRIAGSFASVSNSHRPIVKAPKECGADTYSNSVMTNGNKQKRVVFDFEIDFLNGGGIQGQEFRLDINGDDIEDKALADYILEDMRLLMVGKVRILNKKIIFEKHKRNTR